MGQKHFTFSMGPFGKLLIFGLLSFTFSYVASEGADENDGQDKPPDVWPPPVEGMEETVEELEENRATDVENRCGDNSQFCSHWTSYCGNNDYVKQNCQKTCGKCGGNNGGCSDNDSNCYHWTSYCGNHPYVVQNCKKTCQACPNPVVNPVNPVVSGRKAFKVMSYNVYVHSNVYEVAESIKKSSPDIVGTQETHSVSTLAPRIGNYGIVNRNGVNPIFYKHSKFSLRASGAEKIYEKDQWGQRYIVWAHFDGKNGEGRIDFFNTHLCVCSDPTLDKSVRRVHQVIQAKRRSGATMVLTGDFNTPEHGSPIRYLKSKYKEATYSGGSFGSRKIDFIFTTGSVSGAHISQVGGSDHKPVVANISAGSGGTGSGSGTGTGGACGSCSKSKEDASCGNGGVGCNACGIKNCRFCGYSHFPAC